MLPGQPNPANTPVVDRQDRKGPLEEEGIAGLINGMVSIRVPPREGKHAEESQPEASMIGYCEFHV